MSRHSYKAWIRTLILLGLISSIKGNAQSCYKCSTVADCANPTEVEDCGELNACFTRVDSASNQANLKACKQWSTQMGCAPVGERLMCYCDQDKCNDKLHGLKIESPVAKTPSGGSDKVDRNVKGKEEEVTEAVSRQSPLYCSSVLVIGISVFATAQCAFEARF